MTLEETDCWAGVADWHDKQAPPGKWPCLAQDRGFACTRPKGHDGPHEACGGPEIPDAHPLHTWEP